MARCMLFQMEELPYSHATMDLLQKEIHTCSALIECGVLHHPSANFFNQLHNLEHDNCRCIDKLVFLVAIVRQSGIYTYKADISCL